MPADLRFADPWVLSLLALIPALVIIARRLRLGRPRSGVVLSTLAPLARTRPGPRQRLRPLLAALRLAALALLVTALARPQRIDADATVQSEGIDIVIAIDVSGSMREAGLDTGRKLDGAKGAMKRFLELRRDDRVGLVVFKSESKALSPLSTDYKALTQEVDLAEKLGEGLSEGTGIGVGLADAINLLRGSPAKSRVVILATDGENNQHRIEPEQAGKIAELLKIRVYTIGIPTAGARVDQSLDERQMRQIAEGTGGNYTRATNEQGLFDIFTTIATLEKSRVERERFVRYHELAPWLLIPALGLVALEVLLGASVFRRAP